MSYINVGAKDTNGVACPTKKALRESLSQDLASVVFYNTSPMGPAFRGHVGNIADEATVLTVCGPDPYTKRNWWSNIRIKDGKVYMDDKVITGPDKCQICTAHLIKGKAHEHFGRQYS